MKDVSIYIYTQFHGSLSNGSGIYHIIWETTVMMHGCSEPYTLKKIERLENVTKNKLDLLALREALEHMIKPSNITIYTKSQYVMSAINNGWIDSWIASNFRKKGKEVKHADIWKSVAESINQHNIVVLQADQTEYTNVQKFEIEKASVEK